MILGLSKTKRKAASWERLSFTPWVGPMDVGGGVGGFNPSNLTTLPKTNMTSHLKIGRAPKGK